VTASRGREGHRHRLLHHWHRHRGGGCPWVPGIRL